jgi:hypothetical protein
VETPNELANQIAVITESLGQPVLVEEFIDGREFHVFKAGKRDRFPMQS